MRSFVAFLLIFLSVSVSAQERRLTVTKESSSRVALVIGNAAYKDAPLLNAVNDARDMAKELRRFGFDVGYLENATQRQMKTAIRSFGEQIKKGRVALFYYAGHGVQVNGHNYLIPIEATIASETEVEYEAIDAGFVLSQITEASNQFSIVILDACRSNPFASDFRSSKRGLAAIDAAIGTLIAYSTSPGSVASDGTGRNGLYTEELLKAIQVPDLKIEDVFKRVRTAVRSRTQGKQTPWESSALEGDFYFQRTTAQDDISGESSSVPKDVRGEWQLSLKGPDEQWSASAVFSQKGQELSGVFKAGSGTFQEKGMESKIKGTIKGNHISFSVAVRDLTEQEKKDFGADSASVTFTGTVVGDQMSGTVVFSAGVLGFSSIWTGSRSH